MRRYGVHCSTRHGLVRAINFAHELGCTTLQIFTRSPRLWRFSDQNNEDLPAFDALRHHLKIDPVIAHTPFLPNLSTENPKFYARSYHALIQDLRDCEKLGTPYLIIHPGSFSPGSTVEAGITRLAQAINQAFQETSSEVMLLIENMAGGGRRLGGTFEELAMLFAQVKDQARLGFCLDTAHTFAAGFPIHEQEGIEQTLAQFDRLIGLAHVKVIHVNDSRATRGAHLDLHEHLGQGMIGETALRHFLHHPGLKDAHLILETPRRTGDDDHRNIATLRRLLQN